MFKEKTVIILGAGASSHLGYPTGQELVNSMKISQLRCWGKITKDDLKKNIQIPGNTPDAIWNSLIRHKCITETGSIIYNYENSDADNKFKETIRSLFKEKVQIAMGEIVAFKTRLTQLDPIMVDLFLSQNRDIVNVGKILLAYEMLRQENPEKFLCTQTWYRFLLDALTTDCVDPQNLLQNTKNLTVVTFNYDLSLEYYLESRIKEIDHFKKVADEFLKDLNIIHIYGQLGKFDWQKVAFYDNAKNWPIRKDENKYGCFYEKNYNVNHPFLKSYDLLEQYGNCIQVIGQDKWSPGRSAASDSKPLNWLLTKAQLKSFLLLLKDSPADTLEQLWGTLKKQNYIEPKNQGDEENSIIKSSRESIKNRLKKDFSINIDNEKIDREELGDFLLLPTHIKESINKIQEAEKIFILGFGFYLENIKLIKLNQALLQGKAPVFYTNKDNHKRITTRLNNTTAQNRLRKLMPSEKCVYKALEGDFDLHSV